MTPPPEKQPISENADEVRKTLLRVNMSKAAGPDNIHYWLPKKLSPSCCIDNNTVV